MSNPIGEWQEKLEKFEKAKQSLRYNTDKPKWSLVHWKSMEPMVRVLEFGAKKYSPHNWKRGFVGSELLESAMRHLTAMMDGEVTDSESGLSHAGHVQCNMMFYNYFNNFNNKENDNTEKVCCSSPNSTGSSFGTDTCECTSQ